MAYLFSNGRTVSLWFLAIVAGSIVAASPTAAKNVGTPRTPSDITGIVVHAIGGPDCRDGKPFFNKIGHDAAWWSDWFARQDEVGIHYVIGRDGDVAASMPELMVANHAKGHNPSTVGIELVNDGDGIDPYPESQTKALTGLILDLRTRYGIGAGSIHGHAELDKDRMLPCGIARKVDPGPALDLRSIIDASTPPN